MALASKFDADVTGRLGESLKMAGCAVAAELPGRVESEEKLTNECLLGTIFSFGWEPVRCTSRNKDRLTEGTCRCEFISSSSS